jgi:hypothetical protein
MPDEHAHVAVAEVWRSRLTGKPAPDPGRERDILESMSRYRWWHYYGVADPIGSFPERFVNAPATSTIGVSPESPSFPKLFYGTIGAGLAILPTTSVTTDLYVMRVCSAGISLLILVVAWWSRPSGCALGTVAALIGVLAVHPQFAVMATSAGPDALVNLAGASIWWQSVRAFEAPQPLGHLSALWATAIVAALADRMGLALMGIAFVVSVDVLVARRGELPRYLYAVIGVAAIVASAFLVRQPSVRNALIGAAGGQRWLARDAQTASFMEAFHRGLFDSWWLSLGWVRFSAPAWWYAIAAVVSATASLGILLIVAGRTRVPDFVRMALLVIAVQVAAIYYVFFRNAVGAQGRHLFPVIVPTVLMLCVGWETCFPPRWRPQARVALVLVVAALDAVGWLTVAIPIYGHV